MKLLPLLLLSLPLAACSINVDHDDKDGSVKKIHIGGLKFTHSEGGFGVVKGNGKYQEENRTLTAISKIDSQSAIDVVVKIGEIASMKVEGEENLLKLIKTEQKGDVLVIRSEGSFSTEHPLRVVITTPALQSIQHTGSGNLELSGFKDGEFSINNTGSGDIELAGNFSKLNLNLVGSGDLIAQALTATELKVSVQGSGDVRLGTIKTDLLDANVLGSGSVQAEGAAQSVIGKVQGSGDLGLGDLIAQKAQLNLLGSGDIRLHVKDEVSAQAQGSGDISITGKPAKQNLQGDNVRLES